MPDLQRAIDLAMSYCWNETHGYALGGLGSPTFDCSGLIMRSLYEAGFNMPTDQHGNLEHKGTAYLVNCGMTSEDVLGNAGFIETRVTSSVFDLQAGDIVVMNHTDWSGGHTFFYMENVMAYTSTLSGDNINYPNTIGLSGKAKIEASKTRSWNVSTADDPNPNTGACTEVWVHNFDWSYLFGGYNYNDPGDNIMICRYPGGLNPTHNRMRKFFLVSK